MPIRCFCGTRSTRARSPGESRRATKATSNGSSSATGSIGIGPAARNVPRAARYAYVVNHAVRNRTTPATAAVLSLERRCVARAARANAATSNPAARSGPPMTGIQSNQGRCIYMFISHKSNPLKERGCQPAKLLLEPRTTGSGRPFEAALCSLPLRCNRVDLLLAGRRERQQPFALIGAALSRNPAVRDQRAQRSAQGGAVDAKESAQVAL